MGIKKKEINILLLGETGVGKSTFINAFVNYLKFDTLEDAKNGELEVLITSKFSIMDDDFETKTIKIGEDDSNEQLDHVGMSATQGCKSYLFQADNNVYIRLIDSPGIGDTRGIDQDKKNFENILKYLGHHKYLNGICILLKPNQSRLNVIFKFCIQELLSHIHKNAKDNIVFCFTNARGTFYRPGDTLPALKSQLNELKERSGVEIKTNKDTMYCFDNESFRFLAAIKGGIIFTEEDEKSFAESWKRSVDESFKLFTYLASSKPHKIKDTLSLNHARKIVIVLSKPLAEIGQLIQVNISLIREQQNDIENFSQSIEQLEDRLYIPQLDLEPVQLGYPRTVCTSKCCVEVLTIGENNSLKKKNYKTHCHTRCYLDNVECNVVNNSALQKCNAMRDGICKKCGCIWDKHMHISYENRHVIKHIVDLNIENQIKETKSFQEKKKAIIEDKQKRIDQLKNEQQIITDINVQFAQFLRQSAIAIFNNAYADYLDHFIEQEKIKKNRKKEYMEKIEAINKAIENNDPSVPPVSPEDISNLEEQLYTLPINGHTLKNIKDGAERSLTNVFRTHTQQGLTIEYSIGTSAYPGRPRIGINEPPLVPYTIPILGHTFNYLIHTKSFLKACKEQYGDCFSIYVFGRVITIAARNSINEVFKNFGSANAESIPFHTLFTYSNGLSKEVIRFNSKLTREEISAKFDNYAPIIQKYISKGIDNWIGDCEVFYDTWMRANNIIALAIVNILVGEKAASFDLVNTLANWPFDLGILVTLPPILSFIHPKLHDFVTTLPIKLGWNPITYHRKVVIDNVRPIIERRLYDKEVLGDNYKPCNDLLEYYINQPDFVNRFQYYIDTLFILSFGAIGTTSRATTNALFDLGGRPQFVNELYEEALQIDKECNGSPYLADLLKMKKLDSFVKESLRHTDEIGRSTFLILLNQKVTLSPMVTRFQKSKEAYGEDAEEFKPFQFVNMNSAATKIDRSYAVFGGGKHACPGGKIDNKLIIGTITLPPKSGLVFENRQK
ncbi:14214_t:CDS:10 [Funneliformis geosporum]|nr:14214_t:CDS:10 [Funneliformis geosporum]